MTHREPETEKEHSLLPGCESRVDPERLTAEAADKADSVPLGGNSPNRQAGE